MGYEALSEIIVSRLLTWSNADDFVVYQPVFIHYNDKVIPGCSSRDFMRKDEMLIPFERLHRAYEGRGLAQALTNSTLLRIELLTRLVLLSASQI